MENHEEIEMAERKQQQGEKQQAEKQQTEKQPAGQQQAGQQQAGQQQAGQQPAGQQPAGQQQGDSQSVKGKKVAILATDGFEQVELTEPRKALDAAGAETRVVSPKSGTIRGWNFTNWGDEVKVDMQLDQAQPDDFDALLLPGGVMNPDKLRMDDKAVAFVEAFFDAGKPVAAICHGPWTIIEADAAEGRRIAAWPSLKTDLRNAGAEWVDEEACVDGNLVSARKPEDIPAFNREMLALFARSPEEIAGAQEQADEVVAMYVHLEAWPSREDEVMELLQGSPELFAQAPVIERRASHARQAGQ
jgi:protease I